jgi:hypothetical protein
MDWNLIIKNLEETYDEAVRKYQELASVLQRVDTDTLTSAQLQIEQLSGYIASLRTQLLPLKGIVTRVEELNKISTDTINKTQRAISQALKERNF